MKTTKQKETTIAINHEKVANELSKDSAHNWIIEKGINDLKAGTKPGPRMLDFLQHIEVIEVR